jgi:3-hydroxyacyl-[acyl-carrier-protein] dehydratase
METGWDIKRILTLLPHRYPFLLVDRVVSLVAGVQITAFKNVTINEPFFSGHFPEKPIMPGVLIIEGMVQAGGLLLVQSLPAETHDRISFVGIDKARFRAPVVPGDRLVFDVKIVKQRFPIIKMHATARVDEKRVAEAELLSLIGGKK